MNCKYCGAELEEGVTLCPDCGKENTAEEILTEQAAQEPAAVQETVEEIMEAPEEAAEEAVSEETAEMTEEAAEEAASEETVEMTEEAAEEAVPEEEVPVKKKPKVWLIVLAAIAGVAILGVLVCAILYGLGIDLKPRENDVLYKENYTVEAEEAAKNADKVVATVGDMELTNSELQVYYWMTVVDFLNNYSYYLSSFGLDYTQPLNEQVYDAETGMTWQQFFLDNALSSWHRYAALNLQAEEDGYTPDAEMQETIDGLAQQLEELAVGYGFGSAQEMLEEDFGAAVTTAGYVDYMKEYYIGLDYFDTQYEKLVPSDEEIDAYFTENETTLAESGVTKDSGKYYDVRHILIAVEGGTTSEDGTTTTHSEEEWATCLASAQAVLDEWKNGEATEDSFAALATQYSTDTGSASNGGLYTQLTSETNFVEEFKAWYLDESRVVGDTGLVKSVYGYHIMYFSGSQDIWSYTVSSQMISERTSAFIEDCMETWEMDVKYKKIILGEISLAG